MCGANKRFFLYLLLALLFASVVGVLRAEEAGPWYLIPEGELLSIERYKTKSEAEKQTRLLQVQELKTRAAGLRRESETLNGQLRNRRERTRMLRQSFNEYEAETLTAISMKNGEIADLKQEAAERTLEAAVHKGNARSRLIVIIAPAGSRIVFIVFKICRFFRMF
jgi:TolA-binding protein